MDYVTTTENEVQLSRSSHIIYLTFATFVLFFVWAAWAELVEVSTGMGKVIPSSREQTIQSLEGGILTELLVKEGDIVQAGQVLAQLDPTQSESLLDESAVKYRAALAKSTRLTAELTGKPLVFPESLQAYPNLIREETQLYSSRRQRINDILASIDKSMDLLKKEIAISNDLLQSGAASNVEVIRLERQMADLSLRRVESHTQYFVQAREELAQANADVASYSSIIRGKTDALERTTFHSPVRGVVKDIMVTTLGGVIPANGQLMQIVPLDDQLLVEARLSPRDIAFIRPGLEASVKITAYDASIFGDLKGKVVTISPDTIRDEANPEVFYYRVNILTELDYLHNSQGTQFPIVPGMIATVDIKTGSKTVMNYLIKPLNKAREAMRER
ncbi:MAG TPA: HlyD family efflux transporter periplasmic adaptor subunit [Pseudomonadales bacterium]|jgi:adhesin transport system membrane fusion protein|nr:HlyD family efflux transporter periplasmic adaptor subunit [Pseudomonadales bacterium]